MDTEANRIAMAVLVTYDSLSAKYKPVKATDDFFQWVSLSGIVALKQIVALRSFNQFLLHECLDLATSPTKLSPIIRRRESHEISESKGLQPFSILDDLELHMYSSEAPCGDASMESLMEAQVDATPWPVDQLHPAAKKLPGLLRGRESFGELGIVRRKPGATLAICARADSPQTLSKSCSDKLALKQCTSVLSSFTSLLVNPANAYIKSLVLPKGQYSERACQRSFGPKGRMKPVANHRWSGGYAYCPFKVRTTDHEFAFSRRSKPASSRELRTSNVAAVLNPYVQEALILGRLQGRQRFDPKAASAICSKRMWKTTLQVLAALGTPKLLQSISVSSRVQDWKKSVLFADRQRVKADVTAAALSGWIRNDGDDFEVQPG
ncbi:MAG: hypothetical protein Q9172_004387 [Xanthocarpia lactea]